MEFSSNQCFHLFRRRSRHICETIDNSIYQAVGSILSGVRTCGSQRCLPNNESKIERQVLLVVELEYEVR
jgi:hypothetical protein